MLRYILISFFIISNSWAVDLSKHPIYAQIVKNKPTINKVYAMHLSNLIYKVTKKYDVPANIYTAILAQESGYKLEAIRKVKGLDEEASEITVYTDYGIAQIHYKTIKLYQFSVELLLTDLEYSLEAGAKVLKYFKNRYSKREPDAWWRRYNCGTRANVNRQTCLDYAEKVGAYLE